MGRSLTELEQSGAVRRQDFFMRRRTEGRVVGRRPPQRAPPEPPQRAPPEGVPPQPSTLELVTTPTGSTQGINTASSLSERSDPATPLTTPPRERADVGRQMPFGSDALPQRTPAAARSSAAQQQTELQVALISAATAGAVARTVGHLTAGGYQKAKRAARSSAAQALKRAANALDCTEDAVPEVREGRPFPSDAQLREAGWGRISFQKQREREAEEERARQVAAVLFTEREEKERLEEQLERVTRTAELAKAAAVEEQAKAERAQAAADEAKEKAAAALEATAAQGLEYNMKLVELEKTRGLATAEQQKRAEQAKATAKEAEQLQSQELCKVLASTYRTTCSGTYRSRLCWITHATDLNPQQRLTGGSSEFQENPLVPVPLPNDWEQIHTHYQWEAPALATALGWCADVLWLQCRRASAATPPSEGLVRDAQRLAEAMGSADSALSGRGVLAVKQKLEGFVAQAPVLVAQHNAQHERQLLRWFSLVRTFSLWRSVTRASAAALAEGSTSLQQQASLDLEPAAPIWSSDEDDNQGPEQTPAPQAGPVKDSWEGDSPTSSAEEGVPPAPEAKLAEEGVPPAPEAKLAEEVAPPAPEAKLVALHNNAKAGGGAVPPETKQCRTCKVWKAQGAFSDPQWKKGSRKNGANKGKPACKSCLCSG